MPRPKGSKNKLTIEVKDKLQDLIDNVVYNIDIQTMDTNQKLKLLQIGLQYLLPRLKHTSEISEDLPIFIEQIPLSGDAKEYLLELYNEITSDPSVFPKLRYTAHENSKIQKWAGMAGVKKKITPHCARATCANMFVRVPAYNIIDLMELMGHSEVKTTLSYIGTSLMEKTQAIRKMPKVLD